MSLADSIAKLNRENNTNNEETVESPWKSLVHDRALQVNKKNPKLIVRILPPVGDASIFAEYRRWFTSYESKGNTRNTAFVMSAETDSNDPLEKHIQDLANEGKLVDKWGGKNWPSHRYLFNVVPYHFDSATGQMTMIMDQNGLPDVYVLDLGKSQTVSLMNLLGEPMNNPNINPTLLQQAGIQPTQDQVDYSFASSALGYAVYFTWNQEGGGPVKYEQQLLTQYPLPALPQGWETKLADLNSLTMPSYVQKRSFLDWVITQQSSLTAQQPQEQPFANANVGNIDAQLPGNFQTPSQQAHVVGAPPVQQPAQPSFPRQTPSFPTAPTGYQASANAPVAPMQQAPAQAPQNTFHPQPVPQQAPKPASAPASNPLAGFGTVAQKTPQTAPQAPAQAPQAEPAKSESPAPAPATSAPATPAGPTKPVVPTDLASNVQDILSDAGLDGIDIQL